MVSLLLWTSLVSAEIVALDQGSYQGTVKKTSFTGNLTQVW